MTAASRPIVEPSNILGFELAFGSVVATRGNLRISPQRRDMIARVDQRHGGFPVPGIRRRRLGRLDTVLYQCLRAACSSDGGSCSALAKSTVTRAVMSAAE